MISVIVPFYNGERYLKDCIESISKQSYSDIEIICIDDGSNDSSPVIISDLMKYDKRIKQFKQQNTGRSSARNFGLRVSKGDYICFVDADDIIPNNSLELLYHSILTNNSDASVGSIEVDYEAHNELRESDLAYYTVSKKGSFIVTDEVIESFHSSACACLFKKDLIEKFALRFPEGINYEDAYWHWSYFSICKTISFVNQTVYKYIRRPGSIMSQTFEAKDNLAVEHILIMEKIYDFLSSQNLIKNREKTLLRLLEQYFWFAVKYSKKYEISLVAYRTSLLLRKMKFNLENFETLQKIYFGDLDFLYNKSLSSLSNQEIVTFLRIKSIIETLLPKGTIRRAFFHKFARTVYKSIKRG